MHIAAAEGSSSLFPHTIEIKAMIPCSLVIDFEIDPETVSSINELRHFRLKVLEQQLKSHKDVVSHLIAEGSISDENRQESEYAVLSEINDKIKALKDRIPNEKLIYSDELEFFLDLAGNS